jgi:flagellar hook-basal body complex protein FliE
MTSPIRIDSPTFRPYEAPEEVFAPSEGAPSFGDMFKRALGDATDIQQNANDMIQAFLRGEPVELHQVMAASEEATVSLEMLVEIRNKLTEAYRSVMNMQ